MTQQIASVRQEQAVVEGMYAGLQMHNVLYRSLNCDAQQQKHCKRLLDLWVSCIFTPDVHSLCMLIILLHRVVYTCMSDTDTLFNSLHR